LIRFIRENSRAKLFLDPQGMVRQVDATGRVRDFSNAYATMEYTSLVDFIKPNEHEARVMTGHEDPYYSARLMVDWGAEVGIVTLAERGSIIAKERNILRILAYKTFAKDPTGAGDTYAGAFITKYLSGANLYHCGLFASAAASIKVEHIGPNYPLELSEVERRARKLFGD
ncbi:MAG: carbohydrate kinase family protein, partial [Candidatus Bathyarchaeia archaeon]